MRYSQCFTSLSLSVLYTVYFVVHCLDLCGVLMYLFILFQLCRIYNEKKLKKTNHTPIFSVFLFLSLQWAIDKNAVLEYLQQYYHYFSLLSQMGLNVLSKS